MKTSVPHVEFVSSPPEWGGPLRVWTVARLWKLAEELPVAKTPLAAIGDLHRVGWYGDAEHCGRLTVREVADHAVRINNADLRQPILLSSEGFLFDGFHRLAKAWMERSPEILTKQFVIDPEPDKVIPLPRWLEGECYSRLTAPAKRQF